MKKWIWFAIPMGVVLVALMVVVYLTTHKSSLSDEAKIRLDSKVTQLPQDAKQAQKELKKVRADFAKLRSTGPYVVINTHANRVSLRTEDSLIFDATCSTGTGGELVDSATGRHWKFNTPHGVFKVDSKLKQPWWRKPDWAYIEEDEAIPKEESERYDPEMMGDFAIGFGDGYFIHGTIYERLLGVSVTHGCVRLGSDDLKFLYDRVKMGTPVYVF